MKYAVMGNTGLLISRFSLGTMTFGKGTVETRGFRYKVDQDTANRLVSIALDAGINAFDTADLYAMGKSEEMLGKALGHKRKEVIISTKIGSRTNNSLIEYGGSYQHVISATEASLKRLGTDYIDILLIHVDDMLTPVEETIRAMDNLVERGLIRYAGFSNYAVWKASAGYWTQRRKDYARFIAAQMHYSLLNRDIEYDMVPFLKNSEIGLQVWSPLSGGFLSGKYSRDNPDGNGGRLSTFKFPIFDMETGYKVVDKLWDLGKKYNNATPAHIAFAWLLSKTFVTTVILGVTTYEQLTENLKAVNLSLKQEDIDALDKLTEPRPLYPYWMYNAARDQIVTDALQLV